MRIALPLALAAALLGGPAWSEQSSPRAPRFGPDAHRAPTTPADVDRDHAAALACSRQAAALRARTTAEPPDAIARAAWLACDREWQSAALTFWVYAGQAMGQTRATGESLDNLGTTMRRFERRWRGESDRTVARARSEGPRL